MEKRRYELVTRPLMTPGAAEALAVKIYRLVKTDNLQPFDAMSALSPGIKVRSLRKSFARKSASPSLKRAIWICADSVSFARLTTIRQQQPGLNELLRLLQRRLGKYRFCVHAGNPKVSPRHRTNLI